MLKFPLTPHKINNNNNNNDDKLNPSESTTTGKSSSTTTNKKINQRHLLSNINVLEVLVLVQFVDHGKFDVMQKFIYLVQIVLHLVVIVYFQKLKRGNQSGESKAKSKRLLPIQNTNYYYHYHHHRQWQHLQWQQYW